MAGPQFFPLPPRRPDCSPRTTTTHHRSGGRSSFSSASSSSSSSSSSTVVRGNVFLFAIMVATLVLGPLGGGVEASSATTSTTTTTTTAPAKASDVKAMTSHNNKKRLNLDTLAPGVIRMQYAVRGAVVQEADRIADELRLGSSSNNNQHQHPFDHIVYTNIGNPQSVGQQPLTWPRQVLALVDLPDAVGIDHPLVSQMFPNDAIRRAREIKAGLDGHGSGIYTHSQGAKCFRDDVAHFIEDRDGGVPSNPDDIFLTNGASAAITLIFTCLMAKPSSGCLIPIPQYPIYSAEIDLLEGHAVGYHLDESKDWELNVEELERAYQEAIQQGIEVNSMVLINPGNPTGQVLSRQNVIDVVKFCAKHRLVLLADEVYQENVYDPKCEFVSAKRAAAEAGLLKTDGIELVSFHSVSKGVFGECGRRGGYMELVGIDPNVKDMIYKLSSSFLCSAVSGQVMTSLMVRGPDPTDESYESHTAEKRTIYESLKRRAKLVSDGLNAIPGFACNPAQGAMYCFPSVQMPPGAILEASNQGLSPDALYAVSLLQKTGICVVPASGFGQREGRYGFRTTFLPPEDDMARAVKAIASHYEEFCAQYP